MGLDGMRTQVVAPDAMSGKLQRTRDLHRRITLGEDPFLECKEVRFANGEFRSPKRDDLADEIAGFANAKGGTLVLGVAAKTHDVVGIPRESLDAVDERLAQACFDSIDPPVIPTIERMLLPDLAGTSRHVLTTEIEQSSFVHRSPGGYFIRVGSSKLEMSPEFLGRLLEERTNTRRIRFDEAPVHAATLADLEGSLWHRFLRTASIDSDDRRLVKLAMVAEDRSGQLRPTVSGLLMASGNPEAFLPGAFIQAVAYQGNQIATASMRDYQRDAADITGPLDRQIFDACDFVRKNMRTAVRKLSNGDRQDLPQYDMLAVFEAITNAVAHRDYSIAGSKIRLRMFENRLELYIPGRLANTMTPDSLEYRQVSRNEAVTSLLARCQVDWPEIASHRSHIMDKRGEGVPIILSRSETLSGKRPIYRMVDESELILTIFAQGSLQQPRTVPES